MSIATSERYKDKQGELQENTEWHRVVAWDRLAEICQQYLSKGDQVYIEGPIQTRQWEDNDGQTRYTTEIKAREMTMLGSKGSGGGNNGPAAPDKSKPASSSVDLSEDFEDMDDDLPF